MNSILTGEPATPIPTLPKPRTTTTILRTLRAIEEGPAASSTPAGHPDKQCHPLRVAFPGIGVVRRASESALYEPHVLKCRTLDSQAPAEWHYWTARIADQICRASDIPISGSRDWPSGRPTRPAAMPSQRQ